MLYKGAVTVLSRGFAIGRDLKHLAYEAMRVIASTSRFEFLLLIYGCKGYRIAYEIRSRVLSIFDLLPTTKLAPEYPFWSYSLSRPQSQDTVHLSICIFLPAADLFPAIALHRLHKTEGYSEICLCCRQLGQNVSVRAVVERVVADHPVG
jgi:hypothetical protein